MPDKEFYSRLQLKQMVSSEKLAELTTWKEAQFPNRPETFFVRFSAPSSKQPLFGILEVIDNIAGAGKIAIPLNSKDSLKARNSTKWREIERHNSRSLNENITVSPDRLNVLSFFGLNFSKTTGGDYVIGGGKNPFFRLVKENIDSSSFTLRHVEFQREFFSKPIPSKNESDYWRLGFLVNPTADIPPVNALGLATKFNAITDYSGVRVTPVDYKRLV